MKIYIASALTHVPRGEFSDYVKFLHRLAGALRTQPFGHEVKYALANSDRQLAQKPFGEPARLCYLWDRGMVKEADLVIAEASFPSTGLGIELQVAEAKDIPPLLPSPVNRSHAPVEVRHAPIGTRSGTIRRNTAHVVEL